MYRHCWAGSQGIQNLLWDIVGILFSNAASACCSSIVTMAPAGIVFVSPSSVVVTASAVLSLPSTTVVAYVYVTNSSLISASIGVRRCRF